MRILVSGGGQDFLAPYPPRFVGRLVTPKSDVPSTFAPDTAWAFDNGCYSGFEEGKWLRKLERCASVPGCLWVTAPDVVADWQGTLALFEQWQPVISSLGYTVAIVAQDGANEATVPWHLIGALFLGGTTEWKLGVEAAHLTYRAKGRGKLVHMGRVNSVKRLKYAQSIGCDTVDGSGFSRFGPAPLERAVKYLEETEGRSYQYAFFAA